MEGQRDWWPLGLFGLHLAQGAVFAWLYPHGIYDPDLLAYFVYFRNWVTGDTALHSVPYFTVPKPLLVALLGPLGNPHAAFACTALVSAGLGTLVYLVVGRTLGRPVGLLLSLALLLDPEKGVLTVHSSADLYIAALLFAALYLSGERRLVASSVCLLLSALAKPVTLPCALYFLADREARVRTRWLCALLPLAAVPLVLAANRALLGSITGPDQFFAVFDTLHEGLPLGPGELFHFVAWTQLVKRTFVTTAPWGIVGLALWLRRDRGNLTAPFLLVPLLFLLGYLGFSVVSPYDPFFRFFWFIEIWFAAFIVHGMLETARRVAGRRPLLRTALAAGLLCFVAGEYLARQVDYRNRFALPFEKAMAFVRTTPETLRQERREGETVLAPLAFLFYLVWALDVPTPAGVVLTPEAAAAEGVRPAPDWIVYVPSISATRAGRALLREVAHNGGYEVRVSDGVSALLGRPRVSHGRRERADG